MVRQKLWSCDSQKNFLEWSKHSLHWWVENEQQCAIRYALWKSGAKLKQHCRMNYLNNISSLNSNSLLNNLYQILSCSKSDWKTVRSKIREQSNHHLVKPYLANCHNIIFVYRSERNWFLLDSIQPQFYNNAARNVSNYISFLKSELKMVETYL